jgi:hypothetical protein
MIEWINKLPAYEDAPLDYLFGRMMYNGPAHRALYGLPLERTLRPEDPTWLEPPIDAFPPSDNEEENTDEKDDEEENSDEKKESETNNNNNNNNNNDMETA